MAFIRHIETLVPGQGYSQDFISEVMLDRTESRTAEKYIRRIYPESGIDRRYSVLEEFGAKSRDSNLFQQGSEAATTGERNALYVQETKKLIPEVARRTMENCRGVEPKDITHVVTVSCTGFFNPGPDLLVIEALGLSSSVERYHLGFMGCYAAFPALKMADQFCRLNSSANVLVVCIEFCSLHLQNAEDLDSIVANSLFSDGIAAAVVSGSAPISGERGYSLCHFSSDLAREGMADMAWNIGDHGFDIVLSKYVGRILKAAIADVVSRVFSECERSPSQIERWAIHPGGRAILDKVEASLLLRPEQLKNSRSVLSQFGNMSSATVLFVLAEILGDSESKEGESVCAMAFGPGLTIETAVLDLVES